MEKHPPPALGHEHSTLSEFPAEVSVSPLVGLIRLVTHLTGIALDVLHAKDFFKLVKKFKGVIVARLATVMPPAAYRQAIDR